MFAPKSEELDRFLSNGGDANSSSSVSIVDGDGDSTNEAQSISRTNLTVTLSDVGNVVGGTFCG